LRVRLKSDTTSSIMKRACRTGRLFWSLLSIAACGQGKGSDPQAARTNEAILLDGARLIIGDGSTLESSAIVVENGHVARVGRKGEVDVPAGARRIDATGKTIMPAVIDADSQLG